MLCQIIKEAKYDAQLLIISKNYTRFDEIDEAIDWALAHKPDQFTHLKGNFYLWKTDKLQNFPSLLILYHFDPVAKIVKLYDIKEIK